MTTLTLEVVETAQDPIAVVECLQHGLGRHLVGSLERDSSRGFRPHLW